MILGTGGRARDRQTMLKGRRSHVYEAHCIACRPVLIYVLAVSEPFFTLWWVTRVTQGGGDLTSSVWADVWLQASGLQDATLEVETPQTLVRILSFVL